MIYQKVLVGGDYQHQAQGLITEFIYELRGMEML